MAEWFESWFDTEYYHMLYNKRNDEEASTFIRALFSHLRLNPGSRLADIACGKGRHSFVMAGLGMQVHGYDLSCNSISAASAKNVPGTTFHVHDIRCPYQESGFDAAFNLFTSFGYFSDPEDDRRALKCVYDMLRNGGIFVQDYLNGSPVAAKLPWRGMEERGHVRFDLFKRYDPPFILKDIVVNDGDTSSQFTEKVKVYSLDELTGIHRSAGFEVLEVLGNYQLEPFEPEHSPRMILISRKP